MKKIQLDECGDGVCELLDQVPNPSTYSLNFRGDHCSLQFSEFIPGRCVLTLVEAEKLADVLPRFNVTDLYLTLDDCSAAAVNRLGSITHQTLKEVLTLKSARRNPAAAAALGQLLSEMSSLGKLTLTGVDGSILKAEEMEALRISNSHHLIT